LNTALKKAVRALAEKVKSWVTNDLAKPSSFVLHEKSMDPTPDEPPPEIEVDGRDVLRLEPAAFAADDLTTKVRLYAHPTLRGAIFVGPDDHGDWEVQTSENVSMNYA
jgi:hypothetical protein